jgi:formylglycine-generating enzyme required for sulfatase activity
MGRIYMEQGNLSQAMSVLENAVKGARKLDTNNLETFYQLALVSEQVGTPSTARVLRGGSWGSVAVNARSATRIGTAAEWGGGDYGFRLARSR